MNILQNYINAIAVKPYEIDEKRAEEQLKLMKPSFMSNDKYNRKLDFWTPVKDLRPFGPGVYFLFYTIRYFLIVFLILALMSMVPLVIYTRGDGLSHSPGVPIWLKTTIANSEGIEMGDHVYQFNLSVLGDNGQLKEIEKVKNKHIDLDLQTTLVWNCSLIVFFILAIYSPREDRHQGIYSQVLHRQNSRHQFRLQTVRHVTQDYGECPNEIRSEISEHKTRP